MKKLLLIIFVAAISLSAAAQAPKTQTQPQEKVDTVLAKILNEKYQTFGQVTGKFLTKEVWDAVMQNLNEALSAAIKEYSNPKVSPKTETPKTENPKTDPKTETPKN